MSPQLYGILVSTNTGAAAIENFFYSPTNSPSHAQDNTTDTKRLLSKLLSGYGALVDNADEPCWKMLNTAKLQSFDAKTVLFQQSQVCQYLMLIIEGSIRVYKDSGEGREVTLYRVKPGHLCLHNLNNLVGGLPYPVTAISENPVRGLVIPRPEFHLALQESDSFRNYVLRTLTRRLSNMVDLVSGLAFDRLNFRIACWLGRQFEKSRGKSLRITHIEIANELGTTREMISRILKTFEHKRCVQLSRGLIHLRCAHTLKLAIRQLN